MSEIGQDASEYPVSQWTADNDDDGPTLTMTLPPLLLHHEHEYSQHHLRQHSDQDNIVTSPAKISSPCPLCSINNNKVNTSPLFTFSFSCI